jgi:hypothetical protein
MLPNLCLDTSLRRSRVQPMFGNLTREPLANYLITHQHRQCFLFVPAQLNLFYRPNTQHIFVDIGMGFHVEFTWSEALNFIEKREEKITRYNFLVLHI